MCKLSHLLLWTLLGIANVTLAVTENEPKVSVPKSLTELKLAIDGAMVSHSIPGLSIAIIEKEHETWVAGVGFADKESQLQASSDTLFRIGSVSKMFVGLAALKLQDEGKLNLMMPLSEAAPEVEFKNPWARTNPVRLIHLLEHTSGWDDIHLPEYASNDPTPLTLEQGIKLHPHSRISRWRPGDRMSYSNSGPAIVAYVIEKITGMDFEAYVAQNIFQPLEMTSATYRYPANSETLSALYQNGVVAPYWHISVRPSGSVNASARDMANVLKFLTARGTFNGEILMNPRLLRKMEQPQSSLAARAGLKTGYGTTNYTSFYKYFVFNGHNGGVNGGITELAYEPKQGAGYFISINSDNANGLIAIGKLIKAYLTYRLKVPKLQKQIILQPKQQTRYSGYYEKVNPRQEISRSIEQVFQVKRLTLAKQGGLLTDVIDGDSTEYLAVSQTTLRLDKHSQASLALLEDQQGYAIQINSQYYQQISAINAYGRLAIAFFFIALIVIHSLWFFIWIVLRLIKKIPEGASTQVRLWPFFSALCCWAFIILLAVGHVADVFNLLGKPSAISISIMLSSLLFALCSLVGLVQSVRYINDRSINSIAKYFCLTSNITFVTVLLYLGYFGIIGVRTFA